MDERRDEFLQTLPVILTMVKLTSQLIKQLDIHSRKALVPTIKSLASDDQKKVFILTEFNRTTKECNELIACLRVDGQYEAADHLKQYNERTQPPEQYSIDIELEIKKTIDPKTGGTRYFRMDKYPRGQFILFVNVRSLCQQEGRRFEALFRELFFEVQLYECLSRQDMMAKLEEVAKNEYKGDALFVMYVGHGQDEMLIPSWHEDSPPVDNQSVMSQPIPANDMVSIRSVVDMFAQNKCNKIFDIIPKVFIFNCCRKNEDIIAKPTAKVIDIKDGDDDLLPDSIDVQCKLKDNDLMGKTARKSANPSVIKISNNKEIVDKVSPNWPITSFPDYIMFGTYRCEVKSVEFTTDGIRLTNICIDAINSMVFVMPINESNEKIQSCLYLGSSSPNGLHFDVNSDDPREHKIIIVLREPISRRVANILFTQCKELNSDCKSAVIDPDSAKLDLKRSQTRPVSRISSTKSFERVVKIADENISINRLKVLNKPSTSASSSSAGGTDSPVNTFGQMSGNSNWKDDKIRTFICHSCAEGHNAFYSSDGFTQFGQAFSHAIAEYAYIGLYRLIWAYRLICPLNEIFNKVCDKVNSGIFAMHPQVTIHSVNRALYLNPGYISK